MKPDKLPDLDARAAIVAERSRNVVVEAGAGTGKTHTLVSRILELIAPSAPEAQAAPSATSVTRTTTTSSSLKDAPASTDYRALSLSRIAAITFTRKAAGELQLRIRQALLDRLAKTPPHDNERRARLAAALGEVDIAFIGTIHSFADRLLRMRPVEAEISPSYEVIDAIDPVVEETAELLLTSAENELLPEALAPVMAAHGLSRARMEEAQRTIQDYLEAGLRAETLELENSSIPGFDGLVRAMILHRDVPFPRPDIPEPPLEEAGKAVRDFIRRIDRLPGDSEGTRWFRDLRATLKECLEETSPIGFLASLRRALLLLPKFKKGANFPDDPEGWRFWKEFASGDKKTEAPSLQDALLGPLGGWLGARLARIAPVVVAAYEHVKARHECVDQTDLLIKLRDLLEKNESGIRAFYQDLFDHILVDEFQDTDPLQAEILFFLAEDGQSARRWDEVRLRPGRLTIVGDPKQSIYRFRRADIVTYADVRERMAGQGALERRLETNFRSRPSLVRYFNERLPDLLGRAPEEGRSFDREHGIAYYEDLAPGPIADTSPVVHALPYSDPETERLKAERARRIEAGMLAHYLRWLKDSSRYEVRDRETDEMRPVEFGDIAILAQATTNVPLLFRALERFGIPYAARGATLFLREPVIRQLILGLRAVADESDGVAQAAFLRPPFFALDLADVAAGRLEEGDARRSPEIAQAAARAEEASEFLHSLRQARFEGLPSMTARRLMEGTAFARTLALLPNGSQKLAAAREALFILDELVAREGLDFDGATARIREWVDSPVQMDSPAPVSGQAVLVLTIHQAKGLEFPVVVLWDGFAKIGARVDGTPWKVRRDGNWAIQLDGLKAGSKSGRSLIDEEKAIEKEEKKRLYYVAATRARDLLAVPLPNQGSKDKVSHTLVGDLEGGAVLKMKEFRERDLPEWAEGVSEAPSFPEIRFAGAQAEKELREEWERALGEAARPIAVPVAVTALARMEKRAEGSAGGGERPGSGKPGGRAADQKKPNDISEDAQEIADLSGEAEEGKEASRFGPGFGLTVHAALSAIIRRSGAEIEKVVSACAAGKGLEDHLDDAVKDVRRTLDTLKKLGLLAEGVARYVDYPVVMPDDQGRLITGFIDLVAASPDCIWIIDFKTDPPPEEPLETAYPEYRKQIGLYKELLAKTADVKQPIRAGLLFSATGKFESSPF
jgi:ATP-dependent exoDNAse (exonuclease V) beta subunit